jgi:hypothetical protein
MTMLTFCKLCQDAGKQSKDCWIDSPLFELHVQETHHITIAEQALKTITRTAEQVAYAFEHYPECYNNDGALCARVMRLFPFRNVSITYDQQTKKLKLEGDYDDVMYAFKHISTITRVGRAYRAKHQRDTDTKSVQRELQENFSRSFWPVAKGI